MKLIFTYDGTKYTHEVQGNIIKVYEVPTEYSEDKLYIADYTVDSLEPYPSSDSSKTRLLYYGIYRSGQVTQVINHLESIEYAKD